MKTGLITFILFIMYYLPFSSYAISKDDCYSCHGKKGAKSFVDRAIYEESSHGKFSCNRCHLDILSYPHGRVLKVNCGICHFLGTEGAPKKKASEYKYSVHGKALKAGNPDAPDCQTCHGSHYIFPSNDVRSDTKRQKIPELCSKCHSREYDTYKQSTHGRGLLNEKKHRGCYLF